VTRLVADAVLFDSDGVLVDSHERVVVAWSTLADEFGLEYAVLATQLVGVPAHQTLARHLTDDRLAAAVARLEDLEVETADGTAPVAGARELLAALPLERWTIVTSASRRLGEARWRGAGLPVPARAITADDVDRGKPDPAPFLAGAALLGFDPTRCVVFEDSPSGGVAAIAAGATVVAVGDLAWRVEPAARIRDLRDVAVEVAPDGSLSFTLRPG
jgi:sugar-phosphatase